MRHPVTFVGVFVVQQTNFHPIQVATKNTHWRHHNGDRLHIPYENIVVNGARC